MGLQHGHVYVYITHLYICLYTTCVHACIWGCSTDICMCVFSCTYACVHVFVYSTCVHTCIWGCSMDICHVHTHVYICLYIAHVYIPASAAVAWTSEEAAFRPAAPCRTLPGIESRDIRNSPACTPGKEMCVCVCVCVWVCMYSWIMFACMQWCVRLITSLYSNI
jgi:hypothetical protein